MVKARDGIRSLWDTPERIERSREIIKNLLDCDMQSVINLTDSIDGKQDLRGFDFSMRNDEPPFRLYSSTGVTSGVMTKGDFRDLEFEGFNFSGSLFSNTNWYDCRFRDCLFNQSDLYISGFKGCSFENVRFLDCWIENAGLGLASDMNRGSFNNVEFVGGTFSRAYFQDPRIENCKFLCNISKVDFHASQFNNCVFEGILHEVSFWGRYKPVPSDKSFKGRQIPENCMTNVDFSKATFKKVRFGDCIDLSHSHLPKKGGVFLVKDAAKVFHEVSAEIERKWTGPDKLKAINAANNRAIENSTCECDQVVINPYEMNKMFGIEFTAEFIEIVKSVMTKNNYSVTRK